MNARHTSAFLRRGKNIGG